MRLVKFVNEHQKLIVLILEILFILSLIPVFIVAGYDCASGDDYNFGAKAHLAYVATGSVVEAIKGALDTVRTTYHGWQGTWFDCFVFCLHPEVFSDSAYVFVPVIFVVMQVVCYLLFAHHFIKVRWKIDGKLWLMVGLIVLLFGLQLIPSQKSGIFWWVGCVHYAMPMCMAMMGIIFGDKFLLHHRIADLIGLCVIAALIGGATYPAALLLPMSVFLLWLAGFVFGRSDSKMDARLGGKRDLMDSPGDKRNILLILPFILEGIGLYISVVSPGNAIRSASDLNEGAQPSGGAIATIIKSIIFSVQDAWDMFILQKTFCIIAFVVVGFITAIIFSQAADGFVKSDMQRRFAHPLLFILVMFLLNASMYAPRLYAGGIVSSGYYNFNFWVFFICTISSIIYVCGYFFFTIEKEISGRNWTISMMIALLLCLIFAFIGRHGVKEYTDYVCLEYYLSGQARDYKGQMALQRLLMEEEGVDDVVLPEVNDKQGPLMQMPVVADPENIDNRMTASFYGKKSCRSIPGPDWIEQYGEKYGVSER